MSKAKAAKKEEPEALKPEMVQQIQKLLELTSFKVAVNAQRYPNPTIIERYKELHAEIEKLLEF